MGIVTPNVTLSDPFAKEEIEENFRAIVSNQGNIRNKDLPYGTKIPSSSLRNKYTETTYSMFVNGAPGLPVVGTIMDIVCLPMATTVASADRFYVTDIAWVCSDVGSGDAKVDIEVGHYSGLGWVQDILLVSAGEISASGAGLNTGNQGSFTPSTSELDFSSVFINAIRVLVDTQGTNVMSAATDFLAISVRMRRLIQGT